MKNNIRLQLEGKVQYVPIWCGRPGIGKTSIIRELAREMNMDIYYVTGAKTPEFWSGIPITNTLVIDRIEKHGSAFTHWTVPEIIYTANLMAEKKKVLIFIDDIQIMDRMSQRHFFEFVLERQLHNFKLSKNIAIAGAANHSAESGNEGFYAAVNNRFQWLFVSMEFDYWYSQIGITINRNVASFLKSHPEFREEEESVNTPFATYRSWTQLSYLFDGNESADNAYNLAAGFVSQSAAAAFRKHYVILSEFDFEKMIKSGNFEADSKSIVNQIIFSSIVRLIVKRETAEIFADYIIQSAKKSEFSALVSAVILELNCLINSLDNSPRKKMLFDMKIKMFNPANTETKELRKVLCELLI